MCFCGKVFNQITPNRGGEGSCRLVSALGSRTACLVTPVSLFSPFLVLSPAGKAYAPEFYYDTYNPLWQNRPRVYSYSLQWTQMNPDAVDRILAYRLGIRQVRREICFCRMCLLSADSCEDCQAFILFYSILFYFILFYFILFYFILL